MDRVMSVNPSDMRLLSFRVNDSTHIYNAVVNAFKSAGFHLVEGGSRVNVIWTGYTKTEDIREL